jgi:chromosome segregation protein
LPCAACSAPYRMNWQRTIETADPANQTHRAWTNALRARDELSRLTDAAAQAGLQNALALKLEREQALGAKRSEYDDLTAKLRASDERRLQLERELDPLRQRITDFSSRNRRPAWASSSTASYCRRAGRSGACGAVHRSTEVGAPGRHAGVKSTACTARSQALGAVNLAALDELTTARERKTIPGFPERRPQRGHAHAGRRDPQDRRRNPRAAFGHLRDGQRTLSAGCSRSCLVAAMPAWS